MRGLERLNTLYWKIFKEKAIPFNLDPVLLAAIGFVESDLNTFAMRYEPNWRWSQSVEVQRENAKRCGSSLDTEIIGQQTSWGIMQVMGTVAREYSFNGYFTEITIPEIGVYLGANHLWRFYQKYGSEVAAVSAYNAGSPKKDFLGRYENQGYVDKVMRIKSELLQSGLKR